MVSNAFPEKDARSSRNFSDGIFQVTLPFARHWPRTSSICVESTTPARSTFPSAATSASVPRIGADVITGDATRTRPFGGADPVGDPMRELLAAFRREPRPHLHIPDSDRIRRHLARRRDLPLLPKLREVVLEADGDACRLHDDDHVLLPRPGVVGPVRRAAPYGVAIANDVLVVHQVRPAWHAGGLEGQGLDQHRLGFRRRRHRDPNGGGLSPSSSML